MSQPSMLLRFLGSGAAESFPAPFCTCHNCQVARRNGGRDIRRRSALLVNDDLLIDFGPDVFQALQEFGLDATNVRTLIITHGHSDHLAADSFIYRTPGFRQATELPLLEVYAPADALDAVLQLMGASLESARLRLLPVTAGDEVRSNGYSILALPAAHGGAEYECVTYLVERDGARLLYATDTGPFPEGAWDILARYPPALAIVDATMGHLSGGSHMGIEQVKTTVARLRELAGPQMRAIAHHFSHQANPSHDELTRIYGADDIGVAYDGMLVEVG
ncbi:MAG: MBL fold metallo-hydrolase [Anaerolineae bacterium]|nr:MBL fold metallo-hydrolase [Anaerolineae bacterium]